MSSRIATQTSPPVPGLAWRAPTTGWPWALTWTPRPCSACASTGEIADIIWEAPDDLAAEHGHVFEAAMLAYRAGNAKRAEMLWQEVEAVCSRAWAANYASLDLLQRSGLNRFAPIKPQRWVVASVEHHCGPHGLQHPHVHNVVVADLTAGRHQEVRGGGR
jgi:hypothetical protein